MRAGGGEKSDAPVKTTTTTEVPAPEATTTPLVEVDKNAEQAAKAKIKPEAIKAATTVLDILELPGSGAENYNGYYVGNKAAIVGPDLVTGTPDDAKYRKYPESLAVFSPESGTLTIKATAMDGSPNDHSARFWSIDTTFALNVNNPLLSRGGQLTAADFRQALADEKTFELVSASAGVDRDYSSTGTDGYGAGIVFGDTISGELSTDPLPIDVTDSAKLNGLTGGVNTALGAAADKFRTDAQ